MVAETSIVPHVAPVALARPLEFTPEQVKMIRDTYANGANESEFRVLLEIAKVRNLNPLLRQIWFIKRWDGQKRCEVWAVQTSIDGLRTIAQRTGLYDGQDEPEFTEEPGKPPSKCIVRVYRKDWSRPAVGRADWSEYAAKKRDGGLTQMWSEKPHIMLAKCAEALALRKAFPEDTAGLYVPEEMDSAQHREEPAPKPEPKPRNIVKNAKPVEQPKPEPAPTVAHVDGHEVIEGQVVAEAKTETGRVVRIVDVPPEPPPPSDEHAPSTAAPVEDGPTLCDDLLAELKSLTEAKALGDWIDRARAGEKRGGLKPEEMLTLKAAYKSHCSSLSKKGGAK